VDWTELRSRSRDRCSAGFTNADEVDYETTRKGELEKGSLISQKAWQRWLRKLLNLLKNTFVKTSA
jgi:hypothetical protein